MTVYEKNTQVIQMYYYCIDSSFKVIESLKNNNEIKLQYIDQFINTEKWNIVKYFKEIEILNNQIKKTIHD